jgi:MerR family mercuric resistance operon transcriptional regulator
LGEILSLLILEDGTHCPETKTLAEQKLALVRQKIADLSTMELNLHGFIDACSRTNGERGCPTIDALVAQE